MISDHMKPSPMGAKCRRFAGVCDGCSMPLSSSHACLQFQSVCDQAVECWWEDQHPEWTIFSLGGQHFETLGQIIAFGRDGARSGMDNPVVSSFAAESTRTIPAVESTCHRSHHHRILQPTRGQGSNIIPNMAALFFRSSSLDMNACRNCVMTPCVHLSSERTIRKSRLSAAGLFCALHCIRCMQSVPALDASAVIA